MNLKNQLIFNLYMSKSPSRQASCHHSSAFPPAQFQFHSVLPTYKKSNWNVKWRSLILRLCDSLSTYANLKFFLPWTFSDTVVFDFITSPLKTVGCFPSSFDWSNVKSLFLKNSAFLSTFDFMTIFRADVVLHMNRSIRSCFGRKKENKISQIKSRSKRAVLSCQRWINESRESVNFHLKLHIYLHSNY
jgi:hypothetical protein